MKDNERSDSMWITGGPESLVMNNRTILTFTPEGDVVFGEGIEPSEAARQFWTFLAHMNPLRSTVVMLEAENAAMREIVQAVARFDDDDSYDGAYKCHWCECSYTMGDVTGHTPDCPVTKARALLAQQAE